MLIFFSFFLVLLSGFTFLLALRGKWNKSLLVGLAYPVGMGITSVLMFAMDLVGIRITSVSVNLTNIILVIIFYIINRQKYSTYYKSIRAGELSWNQVFHRRSFSWYFLALLLVILVFVNIMKNLYWPVYAYDSVAGYDLMAKAIAAEGKIAVSLFSAGINLNRGVYPPLAACSFAFAYLFGLASSKIVMSFFFCSLIITFYGILKCYVSALNAIFFTFMLAITPELFNFGVISNTNFPGIIYIGIGGIIICRWFEEKRMSDLILAGILLGLNVWLRNDGIVFAFAGLLILMYIAVKDRDIKPALIFLVITFLPLIAWMLFLKFKLGIMPDRFTNHLFWDLEKLRLIWLWLIKIIFSVKLYGINIFLFFIILILDWKNIKTNKIILPLYILLAMSLYMLVYYQIDEAKQDSISKMMINSFHRGYLVFMPYYLFYAARGKITCKIFNWMEC